MTKLAENAKAALPEAGRQERGKLKKSERRRQILLELKMRPHVRISALSERFQVSPETLRRDLDALAKDKLIDRAHGGASASSQGAYPGHYPGFYPDLDARNMARVEERERIAHLAAATVREGETLMIDSGSTTIQLAKALAVQGTACTVITNSLPVAMTLGHGPAQVLLCPGDYQARECAVTGPETLDYLRSYRVERCMIGAASLSQEGLSETVPGFAAVKREMLKRARVCQLLLDSQKFETSGLAWVAGLDSLDTLITDRAPQGDLFGALVSANIEILVAEATVPQT